MPLSQTRLKGNKKELALQSALRGEFSSLKYALNQSNGRYPASYWEGTTLLHILAAQGKADMFKLVFNRYKQNISVDICNHNGTTPLMLASEHRQHPLAKMLISQQGADVNARDFFGNTPLLRAIRHGDYEAADMLIPLGARTDISNDVGEYPISSALKNGNAKVAAQLSSQTTAVVPGFQSPKVQSICSSWSVVADVAFFIADLVSDVIVTYELWVAGQLTFAYVSLAIMTLPSIVMFLVPRQSMFERFITILQLRFLYETILSITGFRFTVRWGAMRLLMTMLEDIPELIFQLYLLILGLLSVGTLRSEYEHGDEGKGEEREFTNPFVSDDSELANAATVGEYMNQVITLLISIGASLLNACRTLRQMYMQQHFCVVAGETATETRYLFTFVHSISNVFLRVALWFMMLYLWIIELDVGLVWMLLPILIFFQRARIAHVHRLDPAAVDFFIALLYEGPFSSNRYAFCAATLFSSFEIVVGLIIPIVIPGAITVLEESSEDDGTGSDSDDGSSLSPREKLLISIAVIWVFYVGLARMIYFQLPHHTDYGFLRKIIRERNEDGDGDGDGDDGNGNGEEGHRAPGKGKGKNRDDKNKDTAVNYNRSPNSMSEFFGRLKLIDCVLVPFSVPYWVKHICITVWSVLKEGVQVIASIKKNAERRRTRRRASTQHRQQHQATGNNEEPPSRFQSSVPRLEQGQTQAQSIRKTVGKEAFDRERCKQNMNGGEYFTLFLTLFFIVWGSLALGCNFGPPPAWDQPGFMETYCEDVSFLTQVLVAGGVFLLYLVEATIFSSTASFLVNMKPGEHGFLAYCSAVADQPSLHWHSESYHYETRTRTYTDSEGRTRTETYQEKVVTHTASKFWKFDEYWDENDPFPEFQGLISMRFRHTHQFADNHTRQIYENEMRAFKIEHDRDTHQNFSSSYNVSKLSPQLLFEEGAAPTFLRYTFYLYSSLLLCAFPFKVWFASLSDKTTLSMCKVMKRW